MKSHCTDLLLFALQVVLSRVQGISELLGGVRCVVLVAVLGLVQFGLQGRDLKPVGQLLLLQCLIILTQGGQWHSEHVNNREQF